MNAYLVEAKRTAIGRSHPDKGLFRDVRADEMLAALMRGLLDGISTGEELTPAIDDIYIGCVGQHLEQGKNIARLSSLMAGRSQQFRNQVTRGDQVLSTGNTRHLWVKRELRRHCSKTESLRETFLKLADQTGFTGHENRDSENNSREKMLCR